MVNGLRCYVAGPMRGYELYNFPAFDECSAWLRNKGWEVISPAEIDRELGLDPTQPLPEWFTIQTAMQRDLHEITNPLMSAIVLLPGWTESEGTGKEVRTGADVGLDFYFYEPTLGNKRLLAVTAELVLSSLLAGQDREPNDEIRIISETGGAKGQKSLRYDLIPSEALEEVARVYGHGVKKYDANNWRKGYPYSLSAAALERHYHAWKMGEQMDAEGFFHLAAVIFHANTLIFRDKFQPQFDDVHVDFS